MIQSKDLSWNPTIYNIIRWFARPLGQTTPWPSVWHSKYSFFIIFFIDLGTNYCLWTEQNLQSYLKLRNSQNPFFHILETLNKNYEKKMEWYGHSVQIYSVSKFITVIVVKMLVHGHHQEKFHENYENLQNWQFLKTLLVRISQSQKSQNLTKWAELAVLFSW